jgi:hypothetical protein
MGDSIYYCYCGGAKQSQWWVVRKHGVARPGTCKSSTKKLLRRDFLLPGGFYLIENS